MSTSTTLPSSNSVQNFPQLIARKKAEKKPVIGSWLMLPGHAIALLTARMGFDFVLIDGEHGNIDDSSMHVCVTTIAAHGSSPIVRIAAPDAWLVKRALDTGAHGLLCPLMSNAEDARKLVAAAKFPPLRPEYATSAQPKYVGMRGVGSPFAPANFRQGLKEYVATANGKTFIGVQIESAEGLENCEEIAKVDGIDMIFVGPNDLASSLGFPSHLHPTLDVIQDAIKRILKAAHDADKYAGMFCASADEVKRWAAAGFDFLNLGADIIALETWNAQALSAVSELR